MHGLSQQKKKGIKERKRVIVPRKFFDDSQYDFNCRKASSQFEKLEAKERVILM